MSKQSRDKHKRIDLSTEPKKVKAEYYSICEICTEQIQPGDQIIRVENEWVHYDCAVDEGYV